MAIRIQTDQTLYLYEAEADVIVPATGAWSILWMYRHESDLNLASLLAVMYGDFAATIRCGAFVGADGSRVTLVGANGGAETTATGFSLRVGKEYRFGLVHNNVAGTVTLTNDGVPLLQIAFSPVAGDTGFRSLHFAGFGGSPTGHLDSTWARIRVWSAVLTELEQRAEHMSLTPVRTANLVNDWPLDPGATRLDAASGTTQALGIFPTTSVVDGVAFGTGPAEPIHRANTHNSDSTLTNSSISATAPATEVGDRQVLWAAAGALAPTAAPILATPAGWTPHGYGASVPAAGGAVNTRVHLFSRISGASEGAALLDAGAASIFVYSRASYANVDGFGQVIFGNGGPSTSAVVSSITTARARSLESLFLTQGSAQGITPPADFDERFDDAGAGLSYHDAIQAVAGASGTKTFALPGSADFAWGFAEFLALLPPAGPARRRVVMVT